MGVLVHTEATGGKNMVQVIERRPTLGEIIGSNLQSGMEAGFKQQMEQAAQQRKASRFREALDSIHGMPLTDQIAVYGAMGPEFADVAKQMTSTAIDEKQSALKREHEITLAETKKKSDSKQDQVDLQDTFNQQAALLNSGKVGMPIPFFGSNPIWGDVRAAKSEFDGLNIALESKLKDMVNKGQMSNARFQFMLKNLPKAGDSEETNRGKMMAIARELKLDISALDAGVSESKYEVGQSLEQLPSASSVPKGARFKSGNKIYTSDGKNWKVKEG